jgi:cytoskeleton protein RodZ
LLTTGNTMMNIDVNGNEKKSNNFSLGEHLKLTRERMNLTVKDAANRLHLNANIITIIESGDYKNAPPIIFMRGYLRSYAKLLNIDENTINIALSQIELAVPDKPHTLNPTVNPALHSGHPYIRWTTYAVIACLIGLLCIWWFSHSQNATEKTQATEIIEQAPSVEPSLPATQLNPVVEQAPTAKTPEPAAIKENKTTATKKLKQTAEASQTQAMAIPEAGLDDESDEADEE